MERIIDKHINDQFDYSMTLYGDAVLYDRAFPGPDGLKPVQRRALYDMYTLGAYGPTGYKKSARITGDTIGRFQAHGDVAVYGALVTMGNWFSMYYPLVKHDCNFGSMQGLGPASQRYTECAISDFGYDVLISELAETKFVADWMPNYTLEEQEPISLPTKVPLLLVDGSFGIGVGYKNEVPPHPLGDVIDAAIKMINDPNYVVHLYPDQCMSCEIISTKKNLDKISETGEGRFIVRGIVQIDEINGYPVLRIRSTPDRVNLDKGGDRGGIRQAIEKLIENKQLTMVYRLEEHSRGDDMDYRIVLKKGSDPNYVRDILYKNTDLSKTVSVFCSITDGTTFHQMNYTQYIRAFIEGRRSVKYRKYNALFTKYTTEAFKLKPYVELLMRPDYLKLVKDIKGVKGDLNAVIEMLITKYGLEIVQAQTLVNEGGLGVFNQQFLEKQKQKYDEKLRQIALIEQYCFSSQLRDKEIIDDMLAIKKKYARARKSQIIDPSGANMLNTADYNVVITNGGYIKKLTLGDKNIKPGRDTPKHVIQINNTETLYLFTAQGDVFKVPVDAIPLVTGAVNPGARLATFCKGLVSDVVSVFSESALAYMNEVGEELVLVTRCNCIKRLKADSCSMSAASFMYTRFTKQGDSVIGVSALKDTDDVIVYSDKVAIRMSASDIPTLSRSAAGPMAMSSNTGAIDGLTVVNSSKKPYLVIITSPLTGGRKCRINKIISVALGKAKRGCDGCKVIRLGKDDVIKSIHSCDNKDHINIITSSQFMTVDVKDIVEMSSVAPGMELNAPKGDIIIRSWVGV